MHMECIYVGMQNSHIHKINNYKRRRTKIWTSNVDQWLKEPAAKPDLPSSIPELTPMRCSLTSLCASPHTHTQIIGVIYNIFSPSDLKGRNS